MPAKKKKKKNKKKNKKDGEPEDEELKFLENAVQINTKEKELN